VTAVPPTDRAGTIDRDLLLAAAEKAFDFTWPETLPRDLLPERVEYTRLGLRLLVQDNRMRMLGTHGSRGDVILTARVFGAPIPIVKEQKSTTDLTPYLDLLFNRLRSYEPSQARDWWRPQQAGGSAMEPSR